MIRYYIDYILTPSHPLTNREDRRKLWGWIIAWAVVLTVVFCLPAYSGQRSVSLKGVVPQLASKARAILAACPGSKLVSAVAKRGNKSFHPSGRAVDITGDPKCLYAQVKDWKGGVSVDYWSVRCPPRWQLCPHVHIDTGPRLRFAHRKPNRMFATYAQAGSQ